MPCTGMKCCQISVGAVTTNQLFHNSLMQDGLEDKRCNTEHVDKAVVIRRIFCKIPNKPYISKPRDSCSSIGISCEKGGEKSVDIEIVFPSSMFKCLLLHRCKNLMHKH